MKLRHVGKTAASATLPNSTCSSGMGHILPISLRIFILSIIDASTVGVSAQRQPIPGESATFWKKMAHLSDRLKSSVTFSDRETGQMNRNTKGESYRHQNSHQSQCAAILQKSENEMIYKSVKKKDIKNS